ncbi:hypothetical protein JCM3765_000032 [Sporobolomyces pararoseus]
MSEAQSLLSTTSNDPSSQHSSPQIDQKMKGVHSPFHDSQHFQKVGKGRMMISTGYRAQLRRNKEEDKVNHQKQGKWQAISVIHQTSGSFLRPMYQCSSSNSKDAHKSATTLSQPQYMTLKTSLASAEEKLEKLELENSELKKKLDLKIRQLKKANEKIEELEDTKSLNDCTLYSYEKKIGELEEELEGKIHINVYH